MYTLEELRGHRSSVWKLTFPLWFPFFFTAAFNMDRVSPDDGHVHLSPSASVQDPASIKAVISFFFFMWGFVYSTDAVKPKLKWNRKKKESKIFNNYFTPIVTVLFVPFNYEEVKRKCLTRRCCQTFCIILILKERKTQLTAVNKTHSTALTFHCGFIKSSSGLYLKLY